jgi:SAM-dependent methyltransferase
MTDYCDSLSCLHALEHFGLGRYGDPIDPKGHERGLANMARLLKQDGVFYLSVPVGVARVEFNGQRVFDPRAMIDLAKANSLALRELKVIRQGGLVEVMSEDELQRSDLASQRYALGVFVFVKRAQA